MSKKELLKQIRIFRDIANANKLVAFVGAGVSCNVSGMPSWLQLIQKMAEKIGYERCTSCVHKKDNCETQCSFRYDYSSDEFLKIPQYVWNKEQAQYNETILDNVSEGRADVPLSDVLFSIHPTHIITTNYDKLIESSTNPQRDNYDVIVTDEDLLKAKKNHYIVKMHGDISNLESIVLKESDYLNYSQNHILIELFIKSLLANHKFMFLGYSLNDYNIKLIISWINYIRERCQELDSAGSIGYVVLDTEKIDTIELQYFEKNNIEVVNIRTMPEVANIPVELNDDRGKRLYSFLKTIGEPFNERYLGKRMILTERVRFLKKIAYANAKYICNTLYISKYSISQDKLKITDEEIWNSLVEYLKTGTNCAKLLRSLFVDAGINKICKISVVDEQSEYKINDVKISILESESYQLYVSNRYEELLTKCNNFPLSKWKELTFYISLIYGRNQKAYDIYKKIENRKMNMNDRVVFLHNSAVVDSWTTMQFSSKGIVKYIEGISDVSLKDGYSMFLDMFQGNEEILLKIKDSLVKLKEQYRGNNSFVGCSSLGELFEIKRLAMEQYMFHFSNNLIFCGFKDLKTIMKIYAEAIICTNGEYEIGDDKTRILGHGKEKYACNIVDIDILTKMLTIKELVSLLDEYKVFDIKIEDGLEEKIVQMFCDLTLSVISLKLYSRFMDATSTWLNLANLMMHVELSDESKTKLSDCIRVVIENKEFSEFMFSVDFPEWRKSLEILLAFVKYIGMPSDVEMCERIILIQNIENYIINVNINVFRELLLYFWGDESSKENQKRIDKIIQGFPERKQLLVIDLFMSKIDDTEVRNRLMNLIAENFDKLDEHQILEFALAGWLTLSKTQIEDIVQKALESKRNKSLGMMCYPDPLEKYIQLICLLYITGVIDDITVAKSLTTESEFLEFFMDEGTFDYSKMDFSNYMWQNIARSDKFITKIIQHKESIIPKIKKKIEIDTATEFEKKLLYGVLQEPKDILRFDV